MGVPRSVAAEQFELAGRWLADERRKVVVAQVVQASGSSPFAPGAFMLIDERGAIEGSVTGGCVESDVVVAALEIIEGSEPPRLLRYGVSDELAGTVGLMCGGLVDVFVHELRGAARATRARVFGAAAAGEPAAIATLIDGPRAGDTLGLAGGAVDGELAGIELLERNVARELDALAEVGGSSLRHYGDGGETLGDGITVHLHAFAAPPLLILAGAIDYTAAVATLAAQCGYRVLIVDPREPFVRSERFLRSAEVQVGQAHVAIAERALGPRDGVIVFSHDPKLDEPAIIAALGSAAGYVGALGSRRTARERLERLRAAGASEQQLARLHSPCGLDIAAATPEEVAVSIVGELIASRAGRSGEPLRAVSGSIRAH